MGGLEVVNATAHAWTSVVRHGDRTGGRPARSCHGTTQPARLRRAAVLEVRRR